MRAIIHLLTICFFSIALVSCVSFKKSNMEFVDSIEIENKSEFAAINLPTFMIKPMIVKSLKKEGNSEESIKFIKSIKKARILTIDNPSENVLNDFEKFNKSNAIEELVSINDKDGKVKIYGKETEGGFNRLILKITSKQENDLVFVDVQGKFTEEMILDLNVR